MCTRALSSSPFAVISATILALFAILLIVVAHVVPLVVALITLTIALIATAAAVFELMRAKKEGGGRLSGVVGRVALFRNKTAPPPVF